MSTLSPEPTRDPAPSPPASGRPAMRSAAQKTGAGPVGVVGPVLAVLLLALGLLLLRDALVSAGALSGAAWLPAAAEALRGFAPATWLVPVGVALALVALWLIVTALRPRSRKTLPLTSSSGTYLHTRDVARLASGAARDVDGVLDATTSASRSTVKVSVTTTSGDLKGAVTSAVTEALRPLQKAPRVVVRTRTDRQEDPR